MNWYDYIKEVVDKAVRRQSCCSIVKQVSDTDPTTDDVKEGVSKLWINTTAGTVKIYYNLDGVLKSVSLS
jgi:hypothetical protein